MRTVPDNNRAYVRVVVGTSGMTDFYEISLNIQLSSVLVYNEFRTVVKLVKCIDFVHA